MTRAALGYCQLHYDRFRRTGRTESSRQPLDIRFWTKVEKTDTCWLWRGKVDRIGYGRTYDASKMKLAHRVAYEFMVGPIPKGLVLDHLCRVRHCVNPAHLEPVTNEENLRRGWAYRKENIPTLLKSHCVNGHQFTPENTKIRRNGSRKCRACDRDHAARAYLRKKGLVA